MPRDALTSRLARAAVAALALAAVGAVAPTPSLPVVRASAVVVPLAAPVVAPVAGVGEREAAVEVTPARPLRAALAAMGAPVDQVNAAVFALSDEVDVLRAASAGAYRATLASGLQGETSLRALTWTSGAHAVTARPDADGFWRIDRPAAVAPPAAAAREPEAEAEVGGDPVVVSGPVETVLYGLGGADEDEVPPLVLYRAVRLFAHRVDFAREVALGDRVRLIWRRGSTTELVYAELTHEGRTLRFYRGGDAADGGYLDEDGQALSRYLLRTPVDNPRITSGFGMRLHPLLGYTRMHRGVDFGAPVGAPVLAAGEGEVAQARWAGGYGRFVRLSHAGGWATGYGHLSAWAPGIAPGAHVRQGQVIGYVGASGLATGPHLHYEVYRDGAAVDPAGVAQISSRPRLRSPAFESEKRRVADLLARAPAIRSARISTVLASRTTSLGER